MGRHFKSALIKLAFAVRASSALTVTLWESLSRASENAKYMRKMQNRNSAIGDTNFARSP